MFPAVLLVVLSATLVACEPSLEIQVLNQTDKALKIFDDEVLKGTAVAGGELRYKTWAIFSDYFVTAKDINGNVVYSANFTRDDISSKKTYRVVIPSTAKGVEQGDNATGK